MCNARFFPIVLSRFENTCLRRKWLRGKQIHLQHGRPWLIPGQGRYPTEGNDNPLQYSRLENPRDRGSLRAAVHGAAKSQTPLSDYHFTFTFFQERNCYSSYDLFTNQFKFNIIITSPRPCILPYFSMPTYIFHFILQIIQMSKILNINHSLKISFR